MKDLEPNQTIGNYRVIRRIGRGGMGSVYEVESLDLHERYALKTFTYDPKDDEGDVLKNKFLEEGKILARLRHPNIAHVYTLAFDQEYQLLYFVMDLVLSEDGRPYSLENASFAELEEDTALAWFTDVCEALDYIHSQGIVHRDIKPANLLVKQDGHVVLTDFGIAKINSGRMKEEVNPAMTMRIDGNITVLGSNHYMAPEVERGEAVTPAADAYSLGVMMFEMLTGKWYDKVEDPWPLLDGRKYPWKRVLSMLLAEFPGDRPLGYAELARRMPTWEGDDAPVVKPKRVAAKRPKAPALSVPKDRRRFPTAAVMVLLLVFIAAGLAALYLLQTEPDPSSEPLSVLPPAPAVDTEIDSAVETEEALPEPEAEPTPSEPREPLPQPEQSVEPPAAKPDTTVPVNPPAPPEETPVASQAVDYGPVPDRSYSWFGGDASAPQPVEFGLANGARIAFRPYAPQKKYLMRNARDMGTRAHMVEFTRPFWISKFCVEPSALRDFDPKGYEDCRPIEAAVKGKRPVYRSIPYRKILAYCAFLTAKYRSQLPEGYVFRLPTDAEWDRAIDVDGLKRAAVGTKSADWSERVQYNSARMHGEFAVLRRNLDLDRFGDWEEGRAKSGFLVGKGILIGGRSVANPNGVVDVAFGIQPLLDALPAGTDLVYAESERDPLQGADGLDVGDVSKAWVLGRRWCSERARLNADSRCVFHLAIGPDLVGEQAWRTRVVIENLPSSWSPPGRCDWNPKRIPATLSRPHEVDLRLANGSKMTFCAIPRGRFSMSNVAGQDAKSHKVELTYSFWMSKYCVTAEQRREFGRYDCEGPCRELEQAFPGDPVYCAFNRREWDAYCRFLTERYRSQLPDGYVFRLPTEAEYEWAFVADEKSDVKSVPSKHNPGDRKIMERFAKLLKKDGRRQFKNMDGRGFVATDNLCLGGISDANVWGVHDLWLDGWTQWTYDLYDFDGQGRPGGNPELNVFYHDRERDPLHWDGRVARGGLARSGRSGRSLCVFEYESRAHIVLAPDLAAPLEKAERGPCPESDFGAHFIDGATVCALSSEPERPAAVPPERRAQLLTRDPAVPGDRGRAFMTRSEDSPWVQIELPNRVVLGGVVVETHAARQSTAFLAVWISDDGRRWREVAKADRILGRYRFDLRGKNAIHVKYVRIGREPGHSTDPLCLHKVWLYGRR